MIRHSGLLIIGVLLVVLLLAGTSLFTLDEFKDVVMVKTFGEVGQPLWGHKDAGLHFKWPWPIQQLVRYDARTHVLEGPSSEFRTADGQHLVVTAYCTWRIQDPVMFHKALTTIDKGVERLRDRLHSRTGDVVGKHNMSEFVNTDPRRMKLAIIEKEILESLRREAETNYGVEIRLVGIKANGLTETVSKAVIDQQKESQQKLVRDFESRGEAQAKAIQARADKAAREIREFARRKAEDIRTKGYVEAAKLYETFNRAPELAMFLRELDSLRKQLKENTHFILDGTMIRAIQYFRHPPAQVANDRKQAAPLPPQPKQSGSTSGR